MHPRHFVLLYVAQPQASARFYARLLAREPLESSAGFALFALGDDLMAAGVRAGGLSLGFHPVGKRRAM